MAVEVSLQPWRAFQPDGVILFRCGRGGRAEGSLRSSSSAAGSNDVAAARRPSPRPAEPRAAACAARPRLPSRSPAHGLTPPAHHRSDILTFLPGVNIPFDITAGKGPIIADPIRTMEVRAAGQGGLAWAAPLGRAAGRQRRGQRRTHAPRWVARARERAASRPPLLCAHRSKWTR